MTLMTKVFTRIGVRLPKIKQICIRSIRNYPEYNKTRKMDKKMPYPQPIKDIPGPKALPLIGNHFRFMPFIGEYYNVNVLTLMRMLRDKYGDIVKLDGLTQVQPQIFLFCPELCKNMYQCQGKMPMRIAMEPLHRYRVNRENIYGKQYGLVTSQGELWQAFRSIVNKQMMQLQVIKSHVIPIQEIVNEFVENLKVLRDPKTLELPNDFMNELYKWSLESMCSIALNSRLGCLKPNLDINSEPQIMINCVREMFDLIYRLENAPSLWKPTNTKNFEKLCETLDTINAISEKYIEYAKTKFVTVENTNLKDCSVMKRLLCVDKQVAHVMALDIIMSTDTISNAAGALLYYIANNVEKQEKLREEVMSVLPNKTTPITYDTLQRVRYTKACIKESIRLFPIANGILRTMQRDVLIGGYIIPKNSNVLACHGLLSMDPKYFPRPEEFIPERWLRDRPEYSLYGKVHPFVYMPFGYGARTCIGQRFAEMNLQVLILKVIHNFWIEWHYGSLEYKSQIVNTVTSPLPFKLIDV